MKLCAELIVWNSINLTQYTFTLKAIFFQYLWHINAAVIPPKKSPPPPIFTWWKNDLSTTFSICFALVFFLGFTGPLAWTVLLSGHLSCWCWKPSGSMPGGGWQYNSFPCGNNDAELTKKKKIRETYRRMRTTPQLRRALEHQGTHVGRLSANLVSFPRHLLAQVLS